MIAAFLLRGLLLVAFDHADPAHQCTAGGRRTSITSPLRALVTALEARSPVALLDLSPPSQHSGARRDDPSCGSWPAARAGPAEDAGADRLHLRVD